MRLLWVNQIVNEQELKHRCKGELFHLVFVFPSRASSHVYLLYRSGDVLQGMQADIVAALFEIMEHWSRFTSKMFLLTWMV